MQTARCRAKMEAEGESSDDSAEVAIDVEPARVPSTIDFDDFDDIPGEDFTMVDPPLEDPATPGTSNKRASVENVDDDDDVAASRKPLEDQATPSSSNKRARVEDVDDDDNVPAASTQPKSGRWAENFPRPAGTPKGRGLSSFEKFRNAQEANSDSPWAPFESKDDWELARWLITSGVSQTKINDFLKLGMVRSCLRYSHSNSSPNIRYAMTQTLPITIHVRC